MLCFEVCHAVTLCGAMKVWHSEYKTLMDEHKHVLPAGILAGAARSGDRFAGSDGLFFCH